MARNFNEAQLRAVSHVQGPCMVLAGPGSGKTTVITERTRRLVEEERIDPVRILVITFTKMTAQEMKTRFQQLMKGRSCPVNFGTFHGIYFTILKHAYHYNASNIISEEQKIQLIREVLAKHHPYQEEKEYLEEIQKEISKIKAFGSKIQDFHSAQFEDEWILTVFRDYQSLMRKSRWIDFDDMLLYTRELFEERKDILKLWQNKFTYIMIDEFQDINPLQYEIIQMLAEPENNLFIVGDDDQSIYRFRGSDPEIMLNFKKDYPNASSILLDTNYRCSKSIVTASANLISHNTRRFQKEIEAVKEMEKSVSYQRFESQEQEVAYILQEIQEKKKSGASYEEFAILYRTGIQPGFVLEQMTEKGIPFQTKDEIPNPYHHWIAKDIFSYLEIAHGSRIRKDFLRILNHPKRFISRDSLPNDTVSFADWKDFYQGSPRIAERISRLEYDISMLATMRPFATLNYIRKGIGYDDFLREYALEHAVKEEELIHKMEELYDISRSFQSYEQWTKHIEQYEIERKAARLRQKENRGVSVMTVHSSKGLEYRYVYIIEVNEGIFPYKKAVLPEETEEERRIFYVGMTRAKDLLTISTVGTMNGHTLEPSRFLAECLTKEVPKETAESSTRATKGS